MDTCRHIVSQYSKGILPISRNFDRIVNDFHTLHFFEIVADFFLAFKTNIVTSDADFYFHDVMTSYWNGLFPFIFCYRSAFAYIMMIPFQSIQKQSKGFP